MNSASLCSLEWRAGIKTLFRFLAPIDCLKIPALAWRAGNPIFTRFLAPVECLKFPSLKIKESRHNTFTRQQREL
jgi:hypothetical protein